MVRVAAALDRKKFQLGGHLGSAAALRSLATLGVNMGMCAQILAIGPFSADIASWLSYRAEMYANTKQGTVVTHFLFGILEGSTLSRRFAALLGISDPWDFNQHQVDPLAVDFVGLRAFSEEYPEYSHDVEALDALIKAGFSFHFRPEG